MKKLFALSFVLPAVLAVRAQTDVRVSSYSFSTGVLPTYSVVLTGLDGGDAEKWFKDELKSISADVSNKKEVMAVGTRLPEVSSDTIRVYVKADQPKKGQDVILHAAFLVNGAFIGPDSGPRQSDGCKNWMYQETVKLKKQLCQRDLDGATRRLNDLKSDLAGLVREKERAENSIAKTQARIAEDERDKAGSEASLATMTTQLDAKKAEVEATPSDAGTKAVADMTKDKDKMERKVAKLAQDMVDGNKKIEDLQFQIKKNLGDQDAKSKAIADQEQAVQDLRTKLANIN